ncbi:MAG TPA: class I SAM-dependent methyltransferase [Burkholderiales bacterium]
MAETGWRKLIPRPIRAYSRRSCNNALDWIEVLAGRRDDLTPPRNLRFVGKGDFRAVGEHFLRLFVEVGGLKPGARVLDIGSGNGRMAIPLTRYLVGEYWGIEIVADGVAWCRKRITRRFPNFRFVHADVYNLEYNPSGRHQAAQFRFPFDDGHFDFIFLTSVFTHMRPAEVTHYFGEIARMLAPRGRCFATFFLLTPESRGLIASGSSTQPFLHQGDGFLTVNWECPERSVAFPEEWVREAHARAGLRLAEPIRYGSWCGRPQFTSYQDIVLSEQD